MEASYASTIRSAPPKLLVVLPGLALQVLDLLGHRAEDQAEPNHADPPAEQGAALEPEHQPGGAEQRSRRVRVAASLRHDPRADVASADEGHRGGQEDGEEGEEQDQWPPVVPPERPHLLRPADGGQPRRPRARHPQCHGVRGAEHVADPGEQERHAEHGAGQPDGTASRGRQLHRHGGHACEDDTHRRDGNAGGERTARGKTVADHGQPEQNCEHQVRGEAHQHRRGEVGVPAHDRRADDLRPAQLLGLTRVANHSEHAHQCRHHRQQHEVSHHHGAADGRSGGQAQHPETGVVRRQRRLLHHVRGGDQRVHEHRCGRGEEAGQPEEPNRQGHPVPASGEPGQAERAGHRVHRASSTSASGTSEPASACGP